MKTGKKLLSLLLILAMVFSLTIPALAAPAEMIGVSAIYGNNTKKYGHVDLDISTEEFLEYYSYGDVVDAWINGHQYTLPVCSNYDDVDANRLLVRAAPGKDVVTLAINYGKLAVASGICVYDVDSGYYVPSEGITFPLQVTIVLREEGGYYDQWNARQLPERTNVRSDYANLTDAEFANVRNIATTGMGYGILYRGSSPINPEIGRNTYADAAAKAFGVKTFINLADSATAAAEYEGYSDSYYSTRNIVFLNMPVDFSSDEFKTGLANGYRYIASNSGPYYIHCTEGKDRCGIASGVLECLMGASYDEVVTDYLVTYYNYYGIALGSDKANSVASAGIISALKSLFAVEDLSKADLAAEAEAFLLEIGMTDAEIAALKENLSKSSVTIGGLDNNVWMTKYGNVYTDCTAARFSALGFEWGDLVKVSFLDQELVLPVVPTYSYVDSGKPAIIVEKGEDGLPTGNVALAINMGNFAETYGIAEKHTNADNTWYWTACDGVTFPVEISFAMSEKDGYLAEYIIHDLQRTNFRGDYLHLTDAEFANFRNVATTGMGDYVLYRGSSPINPELGRNGYADTALRGASVSVIMNLANDKTTASAYEGFADTYYSNQKVIYLNLGVDFKADDFKAGLADGLRFFAENKGVYYVHCTEGKDRAGLVSALLECFMGASYDEVVADYMTTYYNYYGVEAGTDKYDAIASSNIIKSLESAFGVSDLKTADLAAEAEAFFKEIGLSDSEIAALRANLSANHYVFTDVKNSGYRDSIVTAYGYGIINGFGDGTFRPNKDVTRAEFITMLWKMSGRPTAENTKLSFTDAGSISANYAAAIAWGVENGIINGFEDGSFRPNEPITRAQMSTFAYRYGVYFDGSEAPSDLKAPYGFTDADSIDSNYVDAVNIMANSGYIKGFADGSFRPNDTANRGQAATILLRIYLQIANI